MGIFVSINPMSATNKKHYTSQNVEFQNGDTTVARPLTIKSLRKFMEIFNDYGADMARQAEIINDALVKAKADEKEGVDKDQAAKDRMKEAQQLLKEEDLMDYVDALCQGSLIALRTWGVSTGRGTKLAEEKVDMDYVEEHLDMETAERICEIAGGLKLGDQDDSIKNDPGKAVA